MLNNTSLISLKHEEQQCFHDGNIYELYDKQISFIHNAVIWGTVATPYNIIPTTIQTRPDTSVKGHSWHSFKIGVVFQTQVVCQKVNKYYLPNIGNKAFHKNFPFQVFWIFVEWIFAIAWNNQRIVFAIFARLV